MIVSIPASARMRPAHQLARAQHQLAGRDVTQWMVTERLAAARDQLFLRSIWGCFHMLPAQISPQSKDSDTVPDTTLGLGASGAL
jgi:hypothetical protein